MITATALRFYAGFTETVDEIRSSDSVLSPANPMLTMLCG